MAMEELEVLPDDVEEPPPAPARPGSATMASQPSDGEDLRRRVGRPQQRGRDRVEDDAEEISFEDAPRRRPSAARVEADTNPGARSRAPRAPLRPRVSGSRSRGREARPAPSSRRR